MTAGPRFSALVDVLLDRTSGDAQLAEACRELHALLRQATPEARAAAEAAGDRALGEGLAISPSLAAQCLLDARRTAVFLRGVEAAIRACDGPVEVVYAGTGPFAPLLLLLMDRLDLGRVAITLIDVDERSTASVRSLLDRFGYAGPAVVRADATSYVHPRPVDVAVSETLQRALRVEPFVAIARNLRRQLAPRGVFVPKDVTVALRLVDAEREQARWRGEAGGAEAEHVATLDVDGETVVRIAAAPSKWLALFTEIRVFGDDVLRPYESGLTAPEILWPFSPLTHDVTLAVQYETGAEPGFRCRAR